MLARVEAKGLSQTYEVRKKLGAGAGARLETEEAEIGPSPAAG